MLPVSISFGHFNSPEGTRGDMTTFTFSTYSSLPHVMFTLCNLEILHIISRLLFNYFQFDIRLFLG